MKLKSKGLLSILFNAINTTPFDGYITFKFEVNPHYKRGNDMLNKIHFKIFAYNFVSRIVWNDNYIDSRIEAIKKANLTFGFFVLNKLGQLIQKELDVPIEKIKSINAYPNYGSGVFNLAGEYVGDIRYAWFFVKQGYIADRKYAGVFYLQKEVRYYGGWNGVGSSFRIGDKVFDENWKPRRDEIQWNWITKFCKTNNIKYRYLSEDNLIEMIGDDLVNSIPFKERGSEVIRHLTQAKLAARNMAVFVAKQQKQ